jgi:hypothetical protein
VYQEVSGLDRRLDLSQVIFRVIHKCSFEFITIVCFFSLVVQLIWDRALGLPLERPKSVTMAVLEDYCKKAV